MKPFESKNPDRRILHARYEDLAKYHPVSIFARLIGGVGKKIVVILGIESNDLTSTMTQGKDNFRLLSFPFVDYSYKKNTS